MDTDDLEPPKPKRLEPPVLEEMSIQDLEEDMAGLEQQAAKARAMIEGKQAARGSADSVFKT